ncbi:hypothetical protein CCH79_00009958 [Gambusia affinis]|uniref:Uncharacterized protein n=1 Tax=Gambusia affinis TaxID=33528 RepID=A0A315V743_GAMAF|nr:hypothetical protein CCH79_00009958 [Gambusia affinis]
MGVLSTLMRGLVRGADRMSEFTSKRGPRTLNKGRCCRPAGLKLPNRKFLLVRAMIPEFVVPHLEGFKLKPYVSYRSPIGTEPPLTAQSLFEQVVAPQITRDFNKVRGVYGMHGCSSVTVGGAPVGTFLESSPSATHAACGHRTVTDRPDPGWGPAPQQDCRGAVHSPLECTDLRRPPGTCRSWQLETRTECASVLCSERGFPLVLWQEGSAARGPPGTAWTSLLAVEDVEVIMHAGSQQQVVMAGMPLQSPHPASHSALPEGLPHVPAVPQQDLLIIAAEGQYRSTITRQPNTTQHPAGGCSFKDEDTDLPVARIRLTGNGEGEVGRHVANVVGSGNRTRDSRVED